MCAVLPTFSSKIDFLPRSNEQQIPHPPGKGGGFGMTCRIVGYQDQLKKVVPLDCFVG
jgi:hypothetical protein